MRKRLFAVIKTLTKFNDFVRPYYDNINEISVAALEKAVKDFANAIRMAIISMGIKNLLLEKKKSSESSKDDLANRIIIEAAKHDARIKRIANNILLDSITRDWEFFVSQFYSG